jgi:hypothetical protein
MHREGGAPEMAMVIERDQILQLSKARHGSSPV